jgi:hypothetical protein
MRDAETSPARPTWPQRHGPEALGAATALLVALLFLRFEPSADVAWQLWIGHQLRYGARFYVDIIEYNPPLWFWMAMPIDWLAERIGSGPGAPMVAAMGLASALSVVATGRLLGGIPAPVRAALLVYAALALMLMPLADMGQREHVLLVATLPYFPLAAARFEGRGVSPGLAIAVGIGSAFGFALKHYFLIPPALIEVWLLVGLGRRYRPLRPETVALAIMAALYAVAVVTITPAYLHDIVPMLRQTYAATDTRDWTHMCRPTQYIWAAIAVALLMRPRILARTPLAMAFALAGLGFVGAWLIQFKGWPYHAIPATGCLMMALAALAACRWRSQPPLFWITAPTLIAAPLAIAAYLGPYHDRLEPVTRPMLAGLAPHDSVAIISEEASYAWPLSLRRQSFYPTRFYGMLIMHAVAAEADTNPEVARLGRQVVDETAQDYRCAQPVRILFDAHDRGSFDMKAYFFARPRFAEVMTHYRKIATYRHFDIFQRIAPFPAPPAAACRRGV